MKWRFPTIVGLGLLVASCAGGAHSLPGATSSNVIPMVRSQALTATPTPYPPDTPSKIRSTYGRIGLAQIFDDFGDSSMTGAQIVAAAPKYDLVWATYDPAAWADGNPQALASRYYIMVEDNYAISGHPLSWWQQNHPGWILYACTSDGTPTHDIAYSPGVGLPDVPLDIHNEAVLYYQIKMSLIPYVQAHGYNAVAVDQVLLTKNFMVGGNPELGQTVKSGEYGCGVWNADGTFTTVYQNPAVSNAQWMADVTDWIWTVNHVAAQDGLKVIINHPPVLAKSADEKEVVQNTSVTVDESGFSDYGNYQQQSLNYLFLDIYNYMEWVQQMGTAIVIIDRFATTTTVTPDQLEYSIGTYMMGNEGNADLWVSGKNGAGIGYGASNYHPEYALQLGDPCGPMYGGPSYSSISPQIYYRRFQGGLVVVNSGSLPTLSENASLPTNHSYTDLESRTVTNPLSVASNDAWVLTTTGGTGCI